MEDRLELIIDYHNALTPKQVAVFYDGLYKILDEIKIADCIDIVIEKSSLKNYLTINNAKEVSQILNNIGNFIAKTTGGLSALAMAYIQLDSYISNKYSNPQHEVTKDFVKEFDKPNFKSLKTKFNNEEKEIYNQQTIADRHQELNNVNSNETTIKRIPVKALQMQFVKCSSQKSVKNIKQECKAKFDEEKLKNKHNYRIPITINNSKDTQKIKEVFADLPRYFFIADGILLYDENRERYVGFELEKMEDFDIKERELFDIT